MTPLFRRRKRPAYRYIFAIVTLVLLPLAGTGLTAPAYAADKLAPWLLVDTELGKLAVMKGLKPIKTFDGIAIGRGGASAMRREGDRKTPLGQFEIAWIADSARYTKFFGLRYPTLEIARRALDEKRISTKTFNKIKAALDAGRLPPQDTPLGGNLGIHGLGASDPDIHASFNWTNGCVALTDRQLTELAAYVTIGTTVIIR
ncbi:L,D-transpeptidase [Granulosicoccaceae sp. 1_MG-2023]|nr:L,D-transpeptidase [Granulosicoccaceae sp. 1_MG-2023]